MNDDKRALDALAESVQHSVAAIEKGIEAYVFHGDDFAYRSVVTELRKLLLDKDAASSFRKSVRRAKNVKSLLELQYGKGKNIRLQSFIRSMVNGADDFMDVTPDIYAVRTDILYAATQGDNRVPLNEWLEEHLVHASNGQVLKVGTTIKHIAGKEGSHIINPVGDMREDVAIAFFSEEPTPEAIEDTDFNRSNPWRQFAIDAGMRLLAATYASGTSLFDHSVDIPKTSRTYRPIRMRRKRRK